MHHSCPDNWLAQFSLINVHKDGLKRHSFHFFITYFITSRFERILKLAYIPSTVHKWGTGPRLGHRQGTDRFRRVSRLAAQDERLKELINKEKVMLFMKGDPGAPKCGFSKTISGLLADTG
jgi:hypothetical protein